MLYLFDLDMTLVDSQILESHRKSRRWKSIYKMIEQGKIIEYESISDIMNQLKYQGVAIGLVTSSPKSYALKICEFFSWDMDIVVGFHDTKKHKPHPDPLLLAIMSYKLDKSDIFYFGDKPCDIHSAKRAGINSVACLWGSEERKLLLGSKPDYILHNPSEILVISNERLKS